NATVVDSLKVIEQTIKNNSKQIDENEFKLSQNYVLGSYLFSLESSDAFLAQLIYFDHIGRNYAEIYEFPDAIKNTSKLKLAQQIESLYAWNREVILVVGDSSLEKSLKEGGYKVIKLNYHNYL